MTPDDTPAPADAPTPAPEADPTVGDQSGDSYDPYAPYTDSSGTTYVPAPPLVVDPMPGEDPSAVDPGA